MSFGQYDSSKDMLDGYMMYDMTTGGESSFSGGLHKTKSTSPFKSLIITVLVLLGIAMIYDAVRPKCAHPGCDNDPAEGSSYCLIHNPKYYYEGKTYSQVQTTAVTTRHPVTTTVAKTITKKTTSTRKKDEYDAHDYDNPEDFYVKHHDDFSDYEDAEDYWNDYRTE